LELKHFMFQICKHGIQLTNWIESWEAARLFPAFKEETTQAKRCQDNSRKSFYSWHKACHFHCHYYGKWENVATLSYV
jgi:hypothetical protein